MVCRIAAIMMLIFGSACQPMNMSMEVISGSGIHLDESRPVSGFSRIQIKMGADLAVTQGDTEALTISADDNLLPHIITTVQGGSLIIESNANLQPSQPIRLHVNFETLTEIDILGSSNISGDDLNLEALTIRFDGSGTTRLTGAVQTQSVYIRGRATINHFDLLSASSAVDISGSATVEVSASDTLQVTVAGQGFVFYDGDPVITQNISGSASISQRE
jgi:hypothetical protein